MSILVSIPSLKYTDIKAFTKTNDDANNTLIAFRLGISSIADLERGVNSCFSRLGFRVRQKEK